MKSVLLSVLACLAASPVAHAQFITTNRTIAGGNPVVEAYPVNLIVGRNAANVAVPGLTVDVVAPASVGFGLFADSNTVLNISGGTHGQVYARDTSTVTVSGAAAIGAARVDADAVMRVTGGTITTGGAFFGVGVAGLLEVSGGDISDIAVNFGGRATIRGGTIGTNTIRGLSLGTTSSSAFASVAGGTISNGIETRTGVLDVLAGTINGGLFNYDGSVAVSGGAFDAGFNGRTFGTLGAGNIVFTGTNLVLSAPTPATIQYGGTGYTGNNYTLTGILADGQAINRVVFDATGGTGAIVLTAVAVVPEASTLWLVGAAGLVGVVCRRVKR